MANQARKLKPAEHSANPYAKLLAVDGRHPFKDGAPFSYVEYRVRRRKGAKVAFFNFDLAKEMGLIPNDHPERLTTGLIDALSESFSNMIINEYDLVNKTKISAGDIKEETYMATRYLQLQHPSRTGLTSGDGRSIWNGTVKNRGQTWDISSRGTGATCLSPATAIKQKFYKSGDPSVSYGCGLGSLDEGMADVLFSEVFNRNGIATERILCILEYRDGSSVTVRAGLNLIRPSHFFLHLKQGKLERLKNVADYYIDRQLANGTWAPVPRGVNRYDYLLEKVAETFAKLSARFESEYIFCWLDWDGDNILVDGSIIDFGSIRQFGLYHHEYRFDDTDRWSTNVKEQRLKARDLVQTFAQLVDFLKTSKKKAHARFQHAAALHQFDRTYRSHKRELLLDRMGFSAKDVQHLSKHKARTVERFENVFYNLEMATSERGEVKVPDGKCKHAIFRMRDVLRELPSMVSSGGIGPKEFMKVMRSDFATRRDASLTRYRRWQIDRLQKVYGDLVRHLAKRRRGNEADVFKELVMRNAIINRPDRITGDAIVALSDDLIARRRQLTHGQLYRLVEGFVAEQTLDPDSRPKRPDLDGSERQIVTAMLTLVHDYREGL